MRAPTVVLAVAVGMLPAIGSAQSRFLSEPIDTARAAARAPRPTGPVIAVAPVTLTDDDDGDVSMAAIQRASERIVERLRPIADRLRSDARLRRAGTVLGIGAVALGALRGTSPLTFAGTQAVRFGLQLQLTAIERRSGFVVEPSIGHRSVAVSVRRKFDD